jgi:pimeloyl-ACP methyl ester carboxylesterase
LGRLTFEEVVDSVGAFIDSLPEQPILIGHSMGGLVVQKLIEGRRGVGGACIDSAPPRGVMSLQWSFLKANVPTINPLQGNGACLPDVRWFHYDFCNMMTLAETTIAYERFAVPESRSVPRSSTSSRTRIDFTAPHQPLLFIAGEANHIIAASLNRKNFSAYKDTNSEIEFKMFDGRTHYICAQTGWEEVADYVADWINRT